MINNLRNSVVFLTRIPVGLGEGGVNLAGAVPWFPVVGAMVGAVVGAVAAGLLHVAPPLVAATVAIAVGVLITGAFHHDGLGDVADAFPGGVTRDRRLEILKDSRLGTYGVMALTLVVVMQVSALASLSPRQAFVAAIAAHTIGRSMAVVLMGTMRTATDSGLGVAYLEGLTKPAVAVGVAVGPILTFLLIGPWSGVLVAAALLAPAAMGWWANNKIGGLVGDVLGATEQLAETTVLVAASILTHQAALWPWWAV